MEKIVVGFLGCGNIGCGVYKLLETYGAQIEENEGVGFEVRKILVRSLNKSRAWAIPSTLLTDRPEDVLDNPEIDMVMEFMGGEQPAASYMVRALENFGWKPVIDSRYPLEHMVAAFEHQAAGRHFGKIGLEW